MSERGEQQSCLRVNNNHVRERRTTMMPEREENKNHV